MNERERKRCLDLEGMEMNDRTCENIFQVSHFNNSSHLIYLKIILGIKVHEIIINNKTIQIFLNYIYSIFKFYPRKISIGN